MFLVPAEGGAPKAFAPTHGTYLSPGALGAVWSPDGRLILFKGAPVASPEKVDWWVAPAAGGEAVSTGVAKAIPRRDVVEAPCAWVGGSVVYVSGTTIEGLNIFRARISRDGAVSGPAQAWTAGPGMTVDASIATNGLMAFSRFSWVVNLWEIPLDPVSGLPAGSPKRLTNDGAGKFGFSLSRDGNRLAWSSFAGSVGSRKIEIHVADRRTGRESVPVEVLDNLNVSAHPRLSPDGSWLSWQGKVDGKPAAFVGRPGDGPGREVSRGGTVEGFLPDGKRMLVRLPDRTWALVPIEEGAPEPLPLVRTGPVFDAEVSPDGGWIALAVGLPGGMAQLRVVPLASSGPPNEGKPISEPEAYLAAPRWSPNGRILYFLSRRDDRICLWAQPLDAATKLPAGEAFAVLHAHRNPLKFWGPRGAFTLAVAKERLVLNAAEIRGDIYLAKTRE